MRVNRRYVNSTRSTSSKMLKIYSEDTDTGGTHNLKEDDTQAHILDLFSCLYMFFSRVQRRTLTWLTWPRHPWEENMWEQPAPCLPVFLQRPAATATGWWLHPAVWGKTSPPPPLLSVSQTGSPLVNTYTRQCGERRHRHHHHCHRWVRPIVLS